VTASPAPVDTGIRFVRSDVNAEVRLDPRNVSGTARGTTLMGEKDAKLHTIEHFLAAAAGLGLTNLRVEVTGEEMPILDGSARPFVEGFRKAGILDQAKPIRPFRVKTPIVIEEGATRMRVEPCDRLMLEVVVSFPKGGVERQAQTFEWSEGAFERELEGARTFCLDTEVEMLRNKGSSRAPRWIAAWCTAPKGSRTALCATRTRSRATQTLDLLGDLALLDRPLEARVIVEKGGHSTM
jgi:UDP-3-O-[3-hydroxymyristoyl] N-acetylglucosamine deacetylase